jgi:3-methyladenine DNA glycosylase AlkD
MMSFDAGAAAAGLRRRLDERADPLRAAQAQAYLKHQVPHLGVDVPTVRAQVRALLRGEPALASHDPMAALVGTLWRQPTFEERLAAVEVLAARPALVGTDDLPRLEQMLRESGTWALVDPLAGDIVGRLVLRDPDERRLVRTLERWAVDGDFWIRRSALLSQLGRASRVGAGAADFAPFARWADTMMDEKEFFVRKAIGWVLRETSKRHPDRVADYVRPRAARMSGVTFREAVRRLPPDLADELRGLR